MDETLYGFGPIVPDGARLLILGTMPSVQSLRDAFYYAHPRNAFWPIMARLLGEELPPDADGRRDLLLRHRIALWDVCRSCVREGSLDSSIRRPIANDFAGLWPRLPALGRVLFNGAAAQGLFTRLGCALPDGCAALRMPSTSPAYTLNIAEKEARWRAGMEGFYE